MRKRFVKSVAHWVIMSVILLFPVLMVGISSFGNHETINVVEQQPIYYESNEVNSATDIVLGNIYYYEDNLQSFTYINYTQIGINKDLYLSQYPYDRFVVDRVLIYFSSGNVNLVIAGTDDDERDYLNINNKPMYLIVESLGTREYYPTEFVAKIHKTDYKYAKEYVQVEYVQNYYMREDVNQWCNTFRNLAVNQWYGNLLDTIGLGITNSMMMNVIYTYPLYVLWVYIIDLVVDCLLVIINFGHNALKRLGGDNE